METTFEEVLINQIERVKDQYIKGGDRYDGVLLEMLYFVRNYRDVTKLSMRDGDYRKIVETFYSDMVDRVYQKIQEEG